MKKPTSRASAATVQDLRDRVTQKVLENPKKAATILTQWLSRNATKNHKKKAA